MGGLPKRLRVCSHGLSAKRGWKPLVAEEVIPNVGGGYSERCCVRWDPESLWGQKLAKRPTQSVGE